MPGGAAQWQRSRVAGRGLVWLPWRGLDSVAVMSLWRNFSPGPSCRDQNEAVIALWPEWRPEKKSVNNLPLSSSIWGLIVFC